MKVSEFLTSTSNGPDWEAIRDKVDAITVITSLLGPAPGRRGAPGRRMWWRCPLGTHEDRNPSFAVEVGKPWWKCFGCGEHDDVAGLVMRLKKCGFPEAKRIVLDLNGTSPPSRGPTAPAAAVPAKAPRAAPKPAPGLIWPGRPRDGGQRR
jgi:DNA primase